MREAATMAGGARSDDGSPCRRGYGPLFGPSGCLGGAVSGAAGGLRGMILASNQGISSEITGYLPLLTQILSGKKGNYDRGVFLVVIMTSSAGYSGWGRVRFYQSLP